MQHVPAADRVAGDHRDDGLGQPPDLDLEIEDVQATDALLVHVAVVAANPLVPAGGEGERSLAREDDDADRGVVTGGVERRDQLSRGERTERVPDLRACDRDLRDPVGRLVPDVGEASLWTAGRLRLGGLPIQSLSHLARLIHVTDDS